ncbi:hypothetical protein DM02DRAFT_519581 [Periconia macrospinosa]|uniref:CCHC-type domain-containing protein n=1 Tax=Periconia macrospinosa TaxID=97972 RepID=A0A2V1E0F7_9PLEO|nr:hypothetical protein DM02DRAFT_519581 [Periconia macrospinosa]
MTSSAKPIEPFQLTPGNLAKLKSGKKVNVLVGKPGDSIIAVENAAAALLGHYAGFAKKHLANADAKVLLIENGNTSTVRWICQWMAAGEDDRECVIKLKDLSVSDLCDLYQHAKYLQYESLMDRIHDLVRGRIPYGLSKTAIQKIYSNIPELSKSVVSHVAQLVVNPMAFNYQPYMELAIEDEDFNRDLKDEVHQTLTRLIKRGEDYYARFNDKTHVQAIQKVKAAPTCYKCNVVGHVARFCSAANPKDIKATPRRQYDKEKTKDSKATRRGQYDMQKTNDIKATRRGPYNKQKGRGQNAGWFPVIQVATNGEGIRTCDRVVKRGEMTRTGLII